VTLIVDTNVWVAAHNERDPDHRRCAGLLRRRAGELVAPPTVVAETAWFLEDRHGPDAEARFLRLITAGALTVVDLIADDWERCVELIETYDQLRLGVVDASVVAIAERLRLSELATMNARDFTVVRPVHVAAFDLLPAAGAGATPG